MGYVMDEGSVIGVIVTAGERKCEALVNFGLTIDDQRQIILSAGQLQEKLEFGTAGEQEWVKQSEFGLAYDATSYSVSAYHVDSETTDNFVGAKSSGVEIKGSLAVSNVATLDYTAGYQSLKWDDGIADEDGLTAGFNLGYQANADTVVKLFADHNVSENRYGVGASWQIGAGSLDASYTYIDGLVGSITDDSQIEVAFNLPLGGSTSSTATADATGSGLSSVRAANLLADVMKRPAYLPQRVIVKEVAGERFDILECTYSDFSANEPNNFFDLSSIGYQDFQFSDLPIMLEDPLTSVGVLRDYTGSGAYSASSPVPNGDYHVYAYNYGTQTYYGLRTVSGGIVELEAPGHVGSGSGNTNEFWLVSQEATGCTRTYVWAWYD